MESRLRWRRAGRRVHVGIEARDDLNDVEAFKLPVRGELLKIFGPTKSMAEAHPPGVAEPEEGGAVGILEMAVIGSDLDEAVLVERMIACVGLELDGALGIVEVGVRAVGAFELPAVDTGVGGGVADAPGLLSGPECRGAELGAVGGGDEHVELHVVERVGIGFGGSERPLVHAIDRSLIGGEEGWRGERDAEEGEREEWAT